VRTWRQLLPVPQPPSQVRQYWSRAVSYPSRSAPMRPAFKCAAGVALRRASGLLSALVSPDSVLFWRNSAVR
jgi:hypothetical protein